MNIAKEKSGKTFKIRLEGRLDTTTSPKLEELIDVDLKNKINELEIDFQNLEYISSAGLRVILAMQKLMNKQGSMVIKNVNQAIMDIFETTGFSDILIIH